ncbi:uncharacterized protein YALI1_A09789g [Yarrowia lipolytica]|uniref:Uncharacterized protein n=1 Tax=Yarrowia lipolytica TaxID=4952 RepID=A0A1D8N4B1_YARLL|nr:hypothetical protein YALI1_A09789g [Yarrowia lipolytica]
MYSIYCTYINDKDVFAKITELISLLTLPQNAPLVSHPTNSPLHAIRRGSSASNDICHCPLPEEEESRDLTYSSVLERLIQAQDQLM